ncbi:hypothetical protein A3Q40_02920 [Rhodococcus sp. PBTS 1]|nr:hypothetical protein A3Q40_02920 [Rhodococcus sp. PBTS 1]
MSGPASAFARNPRAVARLIAENDVAARVAVRVPFYSPGRHATAIDVPVLAQLSAHDDVTPIDTARAVARRIPKGEVRTYECGHFEPYLDPFFDTVVAVRSTSSTAT